MKKLLGWSLFILLMLPNVLKADDVALPSSESQEVVITTYPNGTEISGVIQFDCPVLFDSYVSIEQNGEILASSDEDLKLVWQPQKLGNNTIVYNSGEVSFTTTVNVVELDFRTNTIPNPPTEINQAITITPASRNFAVSGGISSIVTSGSNTWEAITSDSWLSLNSTNGAAGYPVIYTVSENITGKSRVGYVYVSGHTHTVTQQCVTTSIAITNKTFECDGGENSATVLASEDFEWEAYPNVDWIYLSPTSAIGETNASFKVAPFYEVATREGSVTIAGNVVNVFQYGLRMKIENPHEVVDWNPTNVEIRVSALDITEWDVVSNDSWLEIVSPGAGKASDVVTIVVAENTSYLDRIGTISIGTETFTIKQTGCTELSFLLNPVEALIEKNGTENVIEISATPDMPWIATNSVDWIVIDSSTKSGAGNGEISYTVLPNSLVYDREGAIIIVPDAGSGLTNIVHTITQKAQGVASEYDEKLFEADGGVDNVSIYPEAGASWIAVSSDETWITILGASSGVGNGEITYIVSPLVESNSSRTGTITVGEKVIYISQQSGDFSINPTSIVVGQLAGAGEFTIKTESNNSWDAIVSDSWITLDSDCLSGKGEKVIRFTYSANNTGKTRIGKIIVGGEVYTIEQSDKIIVSATVEKGGSVSGVGAYIYGVTAELIAIPDEGYAFSHWTGDIESTDNPITFVVDTTKSVTAVFEPLPISFEAVNSNTDGVELIWNNLAWATTYRILRGTDSDYSNASILVELLNDGDCNYFDSTGVVETEYWYWVEAEGNDTLVVSEPMTGKKEKVAIYSPLVYTNLRGATHLNPDIYKEGNTLTFTAPSDVVGYTFAGWTPSEITVDMTGAQTITANWSANTYSITYNSNGGSGEMPPTSAIYDKEVIISTNSFVCTGYIFNGWAIEADGEAVYQSGQAVTNLTAVFNGVIPLYAVWEKLVVPAPVVTPEDGSEFIGDSCEVTISCPLEGAKIYYSPKGATPRVSDSYLYTGPFTITETSTIKAVAVVDGVKSEYTTAVISKHMLTIPEALSATNLVFTSGGESEWIPNLDETSSSGMSVQSGKISLKEETWLETSVTGEGIFSFNWRVDCEWDDSGACSWDYAVVSTNGVEVARIDGSTGWETITLEFNDYRTHTIRWTYHKDDFDEDDATYVDTVWLSNVSWIPTSADEPIPQINLSTSQAEIAVILSRFADSKLKKNITTANEYIAFREWALGLNQATPQDVKDSPCAWLSFILDLSGLVAEEPKQGDLAITSFKPSTNEEGVFNLMFTLKNVKPGSNVSPENLAKVFAIEGCNDLSKGDFSSSKVVVTFGIALRGRIMAHVKPEDPTQDTFFMRVILKD